MMRILIFCSLLFIGNYALADDDIYHAFIGEFYLQNTDYKNAYLNYKKINSHSQLLNRKILDIAKKSGNKEWRQQALVALLKDKPNDILLNTDYLKILIELNQQAQAKQHTKALFQMLKTSLKSEHEAYSNIALILARTNNYEITDEIISDYEDPNMTASLNALALYHTLKENYSIAKQYIEKSLQLDPLNEQSIQIFTEILHATDEQEKAIAYLREKSKQIQSIKLHVSLISLLIKKKNYQEIENIYLKLIKLDAKNTNKWRKSLGGIYVLNNKFKQAKKIFFSLVDDLEFKDEAYFSLGLLSEKQQLAQEAQKYYRLVTKGNVYLKARKRLANLVALQDMDEAIAIIDKINVDSYNDYMDLLSLKIQIFEMHKQWQKVYDAYSTAITFQPNIHLYYNRALVAERMGNINLLEQDLTTVIEKKPDHYEALNALGYSLTVHTNRYYEAKQYIKQALELQPESFYILDSMGWVLYKLGENQQAVEYLLKAMAKKPDPEVAAHLAIVYDALDNKALSDQYLLQALLLDKNNEAVVKAVKLLKSNEFSSEK